MLERPIYDRLPEKMKYQASKEGTFLSRSEHPIKLLNSGQILIGEGHISFPSGEIKTLEYIIGGREINYVGDYLGGTKYFRGDVVSYDNSFLTVQETYVSKDIGLDIDNGKLLESTFSGKNKEIQVYFLQFQYPLKYLLRKPDPPEINTFNTDKKQTGRRIFSFSGSIKTITLNFGIGNSISIKDKDENVLYNEQVTDYSSKTIDFGKYVEEKLFLDGEFELRDWVISEGISFNRGELGLSIDVAYPYFEEFEELNSPKADLGRLILDSKGYPKSFITEKLISSSANYSAADWLTRHLDDFLNSQKEKVEDYKLEFDDFGLQQLGINNPGKLSIDKETWGKNSYRYTGEKISRRRQIKIELTGEEDKIILFNTIPYLINGKEYEFDYVSDAPSSIEGVPVETREWALDTSSEYEFWDGIYPYKGTKESIHFLFDIAGLHGYDLGSLELIEGNKALFTEYQEVILKTEYDPSDLITLESVDGTGPFISLEEKELVAQEILLENAVFSFQSSYRDIEKPLRIELAPYFRADISQAGIDDIGDGEAILRIPPSYERNGEEWEEIQEILNRTSFNVKPTYAYFGADMSYADEYLFDPA